MGRIKTTAELELVAGSTFSSTSTGTTTINSGGGTMNISTDTIGNTLNIATGSGAKAITIGNSTNTTNVDINCGTAGSHLNLTTNGGDIGLSSSAGTIAVNATTGSINIGTSSTTNSVNFGTGAGVKTVTVGSTNTTSATTIQCGTGNLTVSSASGTLVSQLSTGEMTKPLQPAFLAVGGSQTNVTGAGASYTWGSTLAATTIFDQGSDFNTNGTFTAPVTGRYLLSASIMMTQLTVAMTSNVMTITTSNRTYANRNSGFVSADASTRLAAPLSVVADMDSGDTATVTVQISGGAGDTADISATSNAFFSGCLLA